ncbi:HotDog domain-containing protein [Pseudoneurospora amorphoporcata]|uniref:HotDog domain-containing protein n=1 Tax=Pseudoneurospora amorphoporcata TaxID=241081 RepID=A0AAN6NP56_9PEZI|nr:HotDog domain-containing protein [Pseudoneurospora amorphoporcata]
MAENSNTSTIAGDIPPASAPTTQAETQTQTTTPSDSHSPEEEEKKPFTPSLSTSVLLPLTPTTSSAPALSHVQHVWDTIRPNSAIYNLLLSDIVLVAAVSQPTGRILAHLTLQPVHLNSKRILHGAVSGTLCDWAGGMAIAADIAGDHGAVDKEGKRIMSTGVSTDMHLSYCSTAREGDTLEVEAWVSRRGRKLGFTGFEIRKRVEDGWERGERGEVVVVGSHTKYLPFGQKRE